MEGVRKSGTSKQSEFAMGKILILTYLFCLKEKEKRNVVIADNWHPRNSVRRQDYTDVQGRSKLRFRISGFVPPQHISTCKKMWRAGWC